LNENIFIFAIASRPLARKNAVVLRAWPGWPERAKRDEELQKYPIPGHRRRAGTVRLPGGKETTFHPEIKFARAGCRMADALLVAGRLENIAARRPGARKAAGLALTASGSPFS